VVDQVAELSLLVAGVTELARGETPAAGWGPWGPVRLDEVAATAVDAARRDWPKTEFCADLESCVVEGSADRLRVAIRNLLDNAAKFGPPEGPVDVRLAGGSLTVRDHGPGISLDDAPHVFDRFYRSLSARAVPGSGLGLAVVREIARGHRGTVAAESAPGGGTVMRLILPAPPARPGSPQLPPPSSRRPARLRWAVPARHGASCWATAAKPAALSHPGARKI
jgi:signal transduction histidine kinase